MHQENKNSGFTLVEVMIVITMIGILLMISVPNFAKVRNKARINSCLSMLNQIDRAKDQYAAEHNKHSGDRVTWSELVPTYIRSLPHCPSGNSYTLQPISTNPTCTNAEHVLP